MKWWPKRFFCVCWKSSDGIHPKNQRNRQRSDDTAISAKIIRISKYAIIISTDEQITRPDLRFLILGRCHPKGWHFSVLQMCEFVTQSSPRIYCDAGAIFMTEIPELPAIFIFSESIILKVNTKQEVTTMAYKVTQRIASCRAPPGVRRTICPENLHCDRKTADFSAVVIDT